MENYCHKMVDKGLICDAQRWEPHTLQMGGMFHIAFAGILGVATWKKKEENETSWND
jgi:hypothetical protein